MAFDKKKYDLEYRKKNKRQFKVDLNIKEYEEAEELLQKHNMTKVKLVRDAIDRLRKK